MSTATNTVTLTAPVKIDGKEVTAIAVRKPKSGELRGVSLTAMIQMEVGALIKVLPRITQPPLSESQCAELDAPDMLALGTRVVGMLTGGDISAPPVS